MEKGFTYVRQVLYEVIIGNDTWIQHATPPPPQTTFHDPNHYQLDDIRTAHKCSTSSNYHSKLLSRSRIENTQDRSNPVKATTNRGPEHEHADADDASKSNCNEWRRRRRHLSPSPSCSSKRRGVGYKIGYFGDDIAKCMVIPWRLQYKWSRDDEAQYCDEDYVTIQHCDNMSTYMITW